MTPLAAQQSLDAAETFMGLEPIERAWHAGQFEAVLLKRGDVLITRERRPTLYRHRRALCSAVGLRDVTDRGDWAEPADRRDWFLAGGQRTATATSARLTSAALGFDRLSEKLPAIWRTITISLARRI